MDFDKLNDEEVENLYNDLVNSDMRIAQCCCDATATGGSNTIVFNWCRYNIGGGYNNCSLHCQSLGFEISSRYQSWWCWTNDCCQEPNVYFGSSCTYRSW